MLKYAARVWLNANSFIWVLKVGILDVNAYYWVSEVDLTYTGIVINHQTGCESSEYFFLSHECISQWSCCSYAPVTPECNEDTYLPPTNA